MQRLSPRKQWPPAPLRDGRRGVLDHGLQFAKKEVEQMEDIRQTIGAYDRGEIELPERSKTRNDKEYETSPKLAKFFTKMQIARNTYGAGTGFQVLNLVT